MGDIKKISLEELGEICEKARGTRDRSKVF
jgi:hypothetical protein